MAMQVVFNQYTTGVTKNMVKLADESKPPTSIDDIYNYLKQKTALGGILMLKTSFLNKLNHWKLTCNLTSTRKGKLLLASIIIAINVCFLFMLNTVVAYKEEVGFQNDLKIQQSDVFIPGELVTYNKFVDYDSLDIDCKSYSKPDEEFIFTGVISSERTFNTLGRAVYHTWGQEADLLRFYIGNEPLDCDCDECKQLPIIKLNAVSDEAVKKTFGALEHICDNYLDKYSWFVMAQDDGYFKFNNLRKLLHTLDHSMPHYIGLSTLGSWNSLFDTETLGHNYCDGSAVIFSKAAVKQLCPNIRMCSDKSQTSYGDVEIGRCVMQNLGLQCATSTGDIKMDELFYRSPANKHVQFTGDPNKTPYAKKAIHVHQVAEADVMYALHAYYLRSQDIIAETCGLKRKRFQEVS